jgi:hypothetical protein
VVEHCGGSVSNHDAVIDKHLKERLLTRSRAMAAQLKRLKQRPEEYLACAFLLASDRKRYGKLIEDLENDHIQKNDKYPKTLVEAYNLLVHWKQDPKNIMRMLGAAVGGVTFANVGKD